MARAGWLTTTLKDSDGLFIKIKRYLTATKVTSKIKSFITLKIPNRPGCISPDEYFALLILVCSLI